MKKFISLEKNLCITSADSVKKISIPIFETFGIKCFRYLKIFNDNSRIVLCSNPENTKYIYEEGNYKFMWYDGGINFLNEGWHIWQINRIIDDRDIHRKIDSELNYLFGLSHGLTYVQKSTNFLEVFSFDSDSPNVYKYEKEFFLRFIFYFKEQAKKIIKYAESEKIVVPKLSINNIDSCVNEKNNLIKKYLEETKVNRYYLGGKYEGVHITSKEADCINWLLLGKSTQEIAILEKSKPKTIQKHIENIKNKLNCYKQTQLIKIILEIGITPNLEM